MSDAVEAVPVESPEAELPLAEFVKRGNARDAGKDVPELAAEPEPETPTPAAAETEEEPAEPKIAASTGQPDKRTREGRLATIQAQINAETARKHAAKAEADAEEKRVADLRAEATRLAASRPAPAQVPPQAAQTPPQGPATAADYKRLMALPDAPKMNDFTGENAFEEWQFAVNAFVADKRFDERMARQRQQDTQARVAQDFSGRLNASIAKRPELQEKLNAGQIDSRVMPYLMQHPLGHEVLLHLAEHPELSQQLSMLNPSQLPQANAAQIGQIGEIAGMLKARADAVTRGPARAQVSQAKPPIKPLGSSPTVTDDDDGTADENLPLAEFVRRGNKKDPARNLHAVRR